MGKKVGKKWVGGWKETVGGVVLLCLRVDEMDDGFGDGVADFPLKMERRGTERERSTGVMRREE